MEEHRSNENFNGQTENDETKEAVSESILAMLQDKNKFIVTLKEQIQNQKSQLQFYLHRGLSSPKIRNFAGNCVPVMAEENLQINLALNQFCKQNGMKSKILILHERMVSIEKRLMRLANKQEEMVDNVRRFPRALEWLPKVLESNDVLRTELEAFRTCCNRLILIEDERNCLVEQVYSVPAPERMNYNALLVALNEKSRLEKEVAEIKKEQKGLILRLNTIKLPDQAGDSTSAAKPDQNYFSKVARLKEVNGLLAAKVSELQQDARCKEMLEEKMEAVIEDYQVYREKADKKINELHEKLGATLKENERLAQMVEQYQACNEEMKSLRTSVAEMKLLRNERDYYKTQVEDLKSIRDSYSQLIEQPFLALREQEMVMKDQEQHIMELEQQKAMQRVEIEHLKMLLREMNEQVREAISVDENPKEYKEMWTEPSEKSVRDFGCSSDSKPPELPKPSKPVKPKEAPKTRRSHFKQISPMTSLNVQTVNSRGMVETLKAIIESTAPVDGSIHVNNTTPFTLRLTCGSQVECSTPQSITNNNQEVVVQCTNLQNKIKCSTLVMDEFELMKDSSKEMLNDDSQQALEMEDDQCNQRSFGCMFRERNIHDETCNTNSSADDFNAEENSDECYSLREHFRSLVGNNVAVGMLDRFLSDPNEGLTLD